MIPRCDACAWWAEPFDDRHGAGRVGQCRRQSPRVLELEGRPMTRWPLTRDGHGCGQHRQKKGAA